jgi:hypothetical protein
LKEEARLRHQHAAGSRDANGAMSLKTKMIVSNWYTDELGNQARIIKARLKEKCSFSDGHGRSAPGFRYTVDL